TASGQRRREALGRAVVPCSGKLLGQDGPVRRVLNVCYVVCYFGDLSISQRFLPPPVLEVEGYQRALLLQRDLLTLRRLLATAVVRKHFDRHLAARRTTPNVLDQYAVLAVKALRADIGLGEALNRALAVVRRYVAQVYAAA